jgi:hypothetical protein
MNNKRKMKKKKRNTTNNLWGPVKNENGGALI